MIISRSSAITASLLVPLAISVVAIAALIAFPQDVGVWNASAWTLAVAALALIVATPIALYSTLRNPGTRTWPRMLALAVTIAYLVVLVLQALS